MTLKLLTRTEFRNAVFERDGYSCVLCGAKAKDAHHIMERRLWPDGGYYLDNGASVCEPCHIACEKTDISTESVRNAAKIEKVILPPHLESATIYDKWGNPCLSNGQRLRGELFFDESVQKIIKSHLPAFTNWVKYPRTPYLPWSPGAYKDLSMDTSILYNKEVVITEKMDGENTTLYRDYVHARSLDSKHHVSRDWIKNLQSQIGYEIPEGWRLCGENLWAKHSIKYEELESYFYGFSIWNEKNICLSWAETMEYFKILGISHPPVLFNGTYNSDVEKEWRNKNWDINHSEGYVIRLAGSFSWSDFRKYVGKYVRPNHIQTHGHWIRSKIIKNKLK